MDENQTTTPNSCDWYDVSCGLDWFADEIKSIGLWFVEQIFNAIAALFELIPVPDFLTPGSMSIPPAVAWFLEPFRIDAGLALIVAAYAARFILRRIPGIG